MPPKSKILHYNSIKQAKFLHKYKYFLLSTLRKIKENTNFFKENTKKFKENTNFFIYFIDFFKEFEYNNINRSNSVAS